MAMYIFDATLYDKACQRLAAGRWLSQVAGIYEGKFYQVTGIYEGKSYQVTCIYEGKLIR
jgi:hypothetical protein